MPTKTLEAILASPPEREELVVQLFLKDGDQWGEIYRENGQWRIEIYPRSDGTFWQINLVELQQVLDIALTALKQRLEGTGETPS